MGLAASRRIPRVPRYSGYPPLLIACVYGAVTLFGSSFQSLPLGPHSITQVLQPRSDRNPAGLGNPPVSLAATPGITFCFLLLPLLRCFSSRRSPPSRDRLAAGFPHSDTRGSKVVCTSPRLFAAYRVLLRLLEPGHPPCALLSLLLLGVNRLSTSTPVSCSVCQCAFLGLAPSVEVTPQA